MTVQQPKPMELNMDALGQRATEKLQPRPEHEQDAVSDELDIEIVFRDHKGSIQKGVVVSKIGTKVDESRTVAMIFSELTGGVPVAMLPSSESTYLYQYSWLIAAIPVRPKWFQDACERDGMLVELVHQEVMAHRAKFLPDFGDDATGQGGQGTPRVRVTSSLSRPDTDGAKG
jgi:hypothetical protein